MHSFFLIQSHNFIKQINEDHAFSLQSEKNFQAKLLIGWQPSKVSDNDKVVTYVSFFLIDYDSSDIQKENC